MIVGRCELNRDARACIHTIERLQGGLHAGPMQSEPMNLSDDEISGYEEGSLRERLAEQAVSLRMVLIASTAQRDPGAAVDEELSGHVRGALGTAVRAARRRMSH